MPRGPRKKEAIAAKKQPFQPSTSAATFENSSPRYFSIPMPVMDTTVYKQLKTYISKQKKIEYANKKQNTEIKMRKNAQLEAIRNEHQAKIEFLQKQHDDCELRYTQNQEALVRVQNELSKDKQILSDLISSKEQLRASMERKKEELKKERLMLTEKTKLKIKELEEKRKTVEAQLKLQKQQLSEENKAIEGIKNQIKLLNNPDLDLDVIDISVLKDSDKSKVEESITSTSKNSGTSGESSTRKRTNDEIDTDATTKSKKQKITAETSAKIEDTQKGTAPTETNDKDIISKLERSKNLIQKCNKKLQQEGKTSSMDSDELKKESAVSQFQQLFLFFCVRRIFSTHILNSSFTTM